MAKKEKVEKAQGIHSGDVRYTHGIHMKTDNSRRSRK